MSSSILIFHQNQRRVAGNLRICSGWKSFRSVGPRTELHFASIFLRAQFPWTRSAYRFRNIGRIPRIPELEANWI